MDINYTVFGKVTKGMKNVHKIKKGDSNLNGSVDDPDEIMKGLIHFKHNKQEVIVFHILDKKEFDFDFKKRTKFIDMETGETITTDPWHIRESYKERFDLYQKKYKLGCRKQKIDYVPLFTDHPIDNALSEYLKKRKKTY
mgnify:CR=1 FL=1